MTQLKHKKISMLLVCLLVLLFSVAPTFADTADNTTIVGDIFTEKGSVGLETKTYNLNFETEGTYKVTVWSTGRAATILSDLNDYTLLETNIFEANTTGSFDIIVSADNQNSYRLVYAFLGHPIGPDGYIGTNDDYTITIEKIN